MSSYIDAEKLEKDGWSASRIYQYDAKTNVYETKKMTDFPTADVRENVHAHWVTQKIGNGETRYTCSECGASYQADSRDKWEFLFCPNCGAVMGERRGTDV